MCPVNASTMYPAMVKKNGPKIPVVPVKVLFFPANPCAQQFASWRCTDPRTTGIRSVLLA